MNVEKLQELSTLLSSPRAADRLCAMDAISAKAGGRIVRLTDDARVIPLLIGGLADRDRRVQRAAARGVRPWIADDPSLLETVLRTYAIDHFDGGYSHAGLYDTRSGAIWIPRFTAVKGHAALLPDANTDLYFRFEFFLPGQAPRWTRGGASGAARLMLYLVPEWSYPRQRLIPSHDERSTDANAREQERYAADIVAFYRRAALPYDVRVHYVAGGGGHHRSPTFTWI